MEVGTPPLLRCRGVTPWKLCNVLMWTYRLTYNPKKKMPQHPLCELWLQKRKPIITSLFVSSSLGQHWEYIVRFIRIVDEALTILKGLLHFLQDDFSVTGVVHQGYDLFATHFIQLTTNFRQLSPLTWTTSFCCLCLRFLGHKFCFSLNCLEPPWKKSRDTLAVAKMFLTKDRDIS